MTTTEEELTTPNKLSPCQSKGGTWSQTRLFDAFLFVFFWCARASFHEATGKVYILKKKKKTYSLSCVEE